VSARNADYGPVEKPTRGAHLERHARHGGKPVTVVGSENWGCTLGQVGFRMVQLIN